MGEMLARRLCAVGYARIGPTQGRCSQRAKSSRSGQRGSSDRQRACRQHPSRGNGTTAGNLTAVEPEMTVTEKRGRGSEAAKKANAKASQEGKSNPRRSSAAQAELGKKDGEGK